MYHIKSMGTNSAYFMPISANAAEFAATVVPAIEALFITAGWALHDSVGTYRVYSGKTPENTNKYVKFDWTNTTSVSLLPYETWDAVAHTGTNAAYAGTVPSSTINAISLAFFVGIGPHYAMIMPYQTDGNSGGLFIGVFDFMRDAADEDVTFPSTIFIKGEHLGASSGGYAITRARNGAVGNTPAAFARAVISTILGRHNASISNGFVNQIDCSYSNGAALQTYNYAALTAYAGVDIGIAGYTWSLIRGRICGMKIICGTSEAGVSRVIEPIYLNVDANGFLDPQGTSKLHYLLHYNRVRIAIPA